MRSLACLFALLACVAASKEASDSLNFLVFGDWGGQPTSPYTTKAEVEIAEQMGKTARQINSQFTLALGDNFYNEGVKNEYDSRFKDTFEVNASYLVTDLSLVEHVKGSQLSGTRRWRAGLFLHSCHDRTIF